MLSQCFPHKDWNERARQKNLGVKRENEEDYDAGCFLWGPPLIFQLFSKHSCLIENCNNYPCFHNTFPYWLRQELSWWWYGTIYPVRHQRSRFLNPVRHLLSQNSLQITTMQLRATWSTHATNKQTKHAQTLPSPTQWVRNSRGPEGTRTSFYWHRLLRLYSPLPIHAQNP